MDIEVIKRKCSTVFLKHAIDEYIAYNMFFELAETIEWEDGIRSRKVFTRKAKSLSPDDLELHPMITEIIHTCLLNMSTINYDIVGIYLNYYEDGDMWTPNHTHKDTHQLVVSLGAERILTVSNKDYVMQNGDAILFGSANHGVPKMKDAGPRISIATFMTPI